MKLRNVCSLAQLRLSLIAIQSNYASEDYVSSTELHQRPTSNLRKYLRGKLADAAEFGNIALAFSLAPLIVGS